MKIVYTLLIMLLGKLNVPKLIAGLIAWLIGKAMMRPDVWRIVLPLCAKINESTGIVLKVTANGKIDTEDVILLADLMSAWGAGDRAKEIEAQITEKLGGLSGSDAQALVGLAKDNLGGVIAATKEVFNG